MRIHIYVSSFLFNFFHIASNGVSANVRRNATSRQTELENCRLSKRGTGLIEKFRLHNWRCADTIFGVHLPETLEIIPVFWQRIFSIVSLARVAHSHARWLYNICLSPQHLSRRLPARGGKIHKLFIKNNRDTGPRVRSSKLIVKLRRFYITETLRKERYVLVCVSTWCPNRFGIEQSAVILRTLVRLTRYGIRNYTYPPIGRLCYLTVDYLAVTDVIAAKIYVKGISAPHSLSIIIIN